MEVTASDRADGSSGGGLDKLTTKLTGFISDAKNIKTSQFVLSLSALCHVDTDLAYWVWVELFPKLWGILAETQRMVRIACWGLTRQRMVATLHFVDLFLYGYLQFNVLYCVYLMNDPIPSDPIGFLWQRGIHYICISLK